MYCSGALQANGESTGSRMLSRRIVVICNHYIIDQARCNRSNKNSLFSDICNDLIRDVCLQKSVNSRKCLFRMMESEMVVMKEDCDIVIAHGETA